MQGSTLHHGCRAGEKARCSPSDQSVAVNRPGTLQGLEALDLIQKCVLQLAHKIYEKPMSLPEFVLERGRSSAGDARRLRDMFLRLDAGVLCSPVKWPLVRTMRI